MTTKAGDSNVVELPAKLPTDMVRGGKVAYDLGPDDLEGIMSEERINREVQEGLQACSRFSDLPFYALERYDDDHGRAVLYAYMLGIGTERHKQMSDRLKAMLRMMGGRDDDGDDGQ